MKPQFSEQDAGRERKRQAAATKFDFRRPDCIPKSQVRAIHVLLDTFARNLVSSLSSYLHTYLTVNLVSVEQLSYSEFLDGLPSPTCMTSLGLRPYNGNGILELNPSLVFPIVEMLLGGTGKTPATLRREVTEIEQKVLDGLFRVILQDLREAWKPVTAVEFTIDSIKNEPQLMHLMAPNEAVVAIGIEVRIGEINGMLNIAMPSIVIKMMRQKFDYQWSARKTSAGESDQDRMMRILHAANVSLDARLEGPVLKVRDILALCEGNLLAFDFPVGKPIGMRVNGAGRYLGQVVTTAKHRAYMIEDVRIPEDHGRISDDARVSSSPAPASE